MIPSMIRALMACVIVSTMILPALPTMACGPDFSPPVFIGRDKPDAPPYSYAAGQLGIVLPSYVQSYLVIGYRYFSGKPLSDEEQSQFVALWDKYYSSGGQTQDSGADASGWDSTLQSWEDSTKVNVSGAPPQPKPAGNGMANLPQTYESYDNCYTNAYATAANTLRARAQEFGESSPGVQSWVQAQVAVFQNCVAPGTAVPDEAQIDLPLEIRKDRDYQIAAAHFYGGDWDEAEKRFLAIAADPSSPWRATAGLVAARCEIRKGTLGTDDPDERDKDFSAADEQLKKIIADPAFASVKSGAESLRGFVEFRTDPEGRAVELSDLLERSASPEAFGQNVDDYTKLMQQNGGPFIKDESLREKSDMTDWIVSYSFDAAPDAEAHRIARWQQTHSAAWLIAALAAAHQDTPQLAAMLQAAAMVPQDSPAYLTVSYQRNRVLGATGKQAEARQNLDKVLAMQDGLPDSSRNLFLALRMKLAVNLDEFLRYAPRNAVASNVDPMFDDDAAMALTEAFPLSALTASVRSAVLPESLRGEVAAAAWTRAILLRDDAAARDLAPIVTALAPDLKEEFAPYNSAQNADEREFAAAFIILHTSGFQPFVSSGVDQFDPDGHWWCAASPAGGGQPGFGNDGPAANSLLWQLYTGGKVAAPGFLSTAERDAAADEWKAMSGLPSAPDWLIEQTLAWAKAHPDDPRVPEALHFGVHATRYGCSDKETGQLSKEAFTLLHSRYSNSDWTRQTPYWFN